MAGIGDILGILGSIVGSIVAPELGVGAALGGGLGGGLGEFAGTGDLGKGLMSGLLGYGLGSATDLLGSAASDAGADATKAAGMAATPATPATSAVDSLTSNPSSLVDPGLNFNTSPFTGYNSAVPAAAPDMAPSALVADPTGMSLAEKGIAQSGVAPTTYAGKVPYSLSNVGANLTNPSALYNTFGRNFATTTLPIGLGAYGMLSGFGSTGGYGAGTPQAQGNWDYRITGPHSRQYSAPPASYRPGLDPEWNYYPYGGYAGGGSVKKRRPPSMASDPQPRVEFNADGSRTMNLPAAEQELMRFQANQYGHRLDSPNPFDEDEPPVQQYAKGGWIKKAIKHPGALHKELGVPEGQKIPQDKLNAAAHSSNPTLRRRANFAKTLSHFDMGGGVDGTGMGMAPGGGAVSGPGGGLADAIPAQIDGHHPAALSSGEHVVPAHAVSALGDGSSEEGHRQLEAMIDRVMKHKYGSPHRKPRPIGNARKFLPR